MGIAVFLPPNDLCAAADKGSLPRGEEPVAVSPGDLFPDGRG